MSAIPIRPTLQEVRAKAEELKQRIEAQFPNVDVEFVDRAEVYGDWPRWQARGFPPMGFGVDACLLIRGDAETTEEAALLADGEVARLLEEAYLVIRVQRDNHVRCKKSEPLVAYSVGLGTKAYGSYVKEDKRGIVFSCFFDQPHEHEWGKLKPQL